MTALAKTDRLTVGRNITVQFSSSVKVIRGRNDRFGNQNQVSHSRREDTRRPVRNGASLRQSLIVSCRD
jgi:hypothetical protein